MLSVRMGGVLVTSHDPPLRFKTAEEARLYLQSGDTSKAVPFEIDGKHNPDHDSAQFEIQMMTGPEFLHWRSGQK
jgi:hypothetical protein